MRSNLKAQLLQKSEEWCGGDTPQMIYKEKSLSLGKNHRIFSDKEKQKKIHKAALMPPQDLNLFRRAICRKQIINGEVVQNRIK